MRFIRLRKNIPFQKESQYRIVKKTHRFKKKTGRVKKVKVRWHYLKENPGGILSKYVYLKNGLGIASSGPWHLTGFDLKHPERFVAFYGKKLAKKWAKKQKFKVISRKRWITRYKKKGFKWPLKPAKKVLRCPHCQKELDPQLL